MLVRVRKEGRGREAPKERTEGEVGGREGGICGEEAIEIRFRVREFSLGRGRCEGLLAVWW